MKLPPTSNDDSLELKMTPMIDVVFLLLVFFVWTTSFELPEFDLPGSLAELPMGAAEESSDKPPVEKFDEIYSVFSFNIVNNNKKILNLSNLIVNEKQSEHFNRVVNLK